MKEFKIKQVREILKGTKDTAYQEILRKPSMSLGIYYLPAGGEDPQQPHSEDELYYILEGVAAIEIDAISQPVAPGDVFFVAAHVPHRFHTIDQDLTVLVFFAPAEGSLQ